MHPAAGAGSSPYLSIVATAKDAESTQRFVDGLISQIRRYNLSAELVLVDAADRLMLAPEVRRVESGTSSEWKARNAGIRQARGEFILCTSATSIFSDDLVQFLASRQLQAGRLYRAYRSDLAAGTGDIAPPGSGIQFGFGSTSDSDAHGPFLWIEDDTELLLRAPAGGGILRMEIEGNGPAPLHVYDSSGAKLAEWTIHGRDTVRMVVPPASGEFQRLRLRFHGRPDLMMRVFRCDWFHPDAAERPVGSVVGAGRSTLVRLLSSGLGGALALRNAVRLLRKRGDDIFDAAVEFEPGPGWYYQEAEAGIPFRWVDRRAQLDFCFDDGSTHLALLIEPGPALGRRPFDLVSRLPDGKVVSQARIDGLTYVEVPLPFTPGMPAALFLEAENATGGDAVPGDSRVLAYRVFACGRGPRRKPHSPVAWAAHTIRTRTVQAESDQRPEAPPLAEFQLMAREHWLDLRGFTEFEQPSALLDALLTTQASHLGVREEVLARRLRIGQGKSAAVPETAYFTQRDLADLAAHMQTLQVPMTWNRSNWGGEEAEPPAHGEPYLSIVVAARNDNHGGNMLVRMQAFLDSWIGQAKRYGLASEMIVVEWNPPEGRGPLKDELRWPETTAPCDVRFIAVPAEVHRSFANAAAVPLHQMIAKNAGIRRARGQFVMATNLDIVFSPELMQFLAQRKLDPRAMYRMDRYDVANRIPPDASLDELLDFCRTNVIRVAAREGTFDTDGSNIRLVEQDDIVAASSGIRLGRGWYEIEQYPKSPRMRYFEPGALVHFERPDADARQMVFDVEIGPSAQDGWVELEVLDASGAVVGTAKLDGRNQVMLTLPGDVRSGIFGLRTRHGGIALTIDPRILDLRIFGIEWGSPAAESGWKVDVLTRAPAQDWTGSNWQSPYAAQMREPRYLHSNACGDFTMLSREGWFAVRGYPEFPFWPTHLDSFLCYTAYHAGLREVILEDPMRVFHIDHAAIWTPGSEEERSARAAKIGVSLVTYPDLVKYFHYMRRFNAPLILTTENWGLRDVALPESGV